MTFEPWIGEETVGPGRDCRARWAPGWPPCSAPATIHIMSESAIDGVVCLRMCEAHAPNARLAGVYVDEHSPSYPGCTCNAPRPPAARQDIRDLPYQPEASLKLTVRAPYDPDLQARFFTRNSLFVTTGGDGLVHYLAAPDKGPMYGLCGKDLSQAVHSTDWALIACPTCRTTETP